MQIDLWLQERVEEAAWRIARARAEAAGAKHPSRYDEDGWRPSWRPSEYRPTFRFLVDGELLEVSLGDALREIMSGTP
jgi:hypothetical protein